MINYKPEWNWLGRSLTNYLEMHRSTIKSKNIDVSKVKTLTQARKAIFGYKKKNSR